MVVAWAWTGGFSNFLGIAGIKESGGPARHFQGRATGKGQTS
jgi:hypothetical protein